MYYGRTFIFDGIESERYGLYLGEFSGSGDATNPGGGDTEVLTQKIYRRPKLLLLGAEQTPVLTFQLSMYSEDEISAQSFSEIGAWLFGQSAYKVLRICQPDMQEIGFNCFLTQPQIIRVGNIVQGISCTVVCDSPFAWREPKVYTYSYNANAYSITDSINFLNESANAAYTYPTGIVITANIFGGSLTVTNVTDANRQFILTLSPGEVVTINNDLQLISSSINSYPISQFNLHFLRLLPGYNQLTVSGNISSMVITSPIAVKIA